MYTSLTPFDVISLGGLKVIRTLLRERSLAGWMFILPGHGTRTSVCGVWKVWVGVFHMFSRKVFDVRVVQ